MKKIIISITYIKETGGISTSVVNLLNAIHDKYDITLCVPTGYIATRHHIPEEIKIIKGPQYLQDTVCSRKQLGYQSFGRKLLRNFRRVINRYILKTWGIERALNSITIPGQYDVAIAFSDFTYNSTKKLCYDYYIISKIVKAKKKIAWIHNDPEKLGWTDELANKQLNHFDFIVNVSENCKKIFDRLCPDFTSKSKVVLNTYNISDIKEKAHKCKDNVFISNKRIHFVTVARVEIKQKRLDRIISVCQQLKDNGYTSFDWTIVGDGGALESLRASASDLELNDIIHFIGHKDNPYPYIAQADAFILCSDYEGLSMTIKEAQILETPTYVTNFGSSYEAVHNYVQGEVCDNTTESFYLMIKNILENPDKLNSYKENLRNNPVSNRIAIDQFDKLCN